MYILQYKAIPWAKSKAQLAIKKECTSLVTRLGSLGKVQILWEGHKIWRYLASVLTRQSKRFFSNFCGLFRKAELYSNLVHYTLPGGTVSKLVGISNFKTINVIKNYYNANFTPNFFFLKKMIGTNLIPTVPICLAGPAPWASSSHLLEKDYLL